MELFSLLYEWSYYYNYHYTFCSFLSLEVQIELHSSCHINMSYSQFLVPRAEAKYSQRVAQIWTQVPKLVFKIHSKCYGNLYLDLYLYAWGQKLCESPSALSHLFPMLTYVTYHFTFFVKQDAIKRTSE